MLLCSDGLEVRKLKSGSAKLFFLTGLGRCGSLDSLGFDWRFKLLGQYNFDQVDQSIPVDMVAFVHTVVWDAGLQKLTALQTRLYAVERCIALGE